MGRERNVIEAIFREGRSHREVAAAAGVSKAWVTKLVARYRAGAELALEPRSRRPKSCAHGTAPVLQDAVPALRRELAATGHDALIAFNARLKARPQAPRVAPHVRVRHDSVDKAGRVALRYLSRVRHIGNGRYYIGARITLLVAGPHVRVVDDDGRLIRELTIDPTRDYQPLGTPCGRPKIGHYVPRQAGTIT